jgi:signal transduction histidine kinase
MFKNLYLLLDFFLPEHVAEQVDIATIFRARSIVAAGLLGTIVCAILFVGTAILEVPLFIRIGVLCSIIVFSTLIIFLKTRTNNFEVSLNIGAFLQISFLFLIVYSCSFLAKGLGFFSLIWLMPLFLMSTFYFKPRYALMFFCVNIIILTGMIFTFHTRFLLPLELVPNFKDLFLFYFILVFISSFLISYLFVHLNERLKEEIGKQKNLLIESAKFQSLGQMASNLAHDVNNPLFTIQGKLHQIRNLFSHDELDLDKCDHIIEEVESTIMRLSKIVKGISTFARQGHQDQMVSVSADELIRGIVLLGSDRIVQLGIAFDLKVAPDIRVICYPSYISQVLINLLNNAIDAIEHADVKLIQVEAFKNDKWVEIHIRDSGAGVAVDIETKIFDSFFTTKKYGKGTGLGLSISKGLVETHEGLLKYSRKDNMTDFTVYLPAYE